MAYKQAQSRKKQLLKTYRKTKNKCFAGVWFNPEKGCYCKYSSSNTPGYTKLLRRQSNKKVRRLKDLGDYGTYKKAYDYWWTLF